VFLGARREEERREGYRLATRMFLEVVRKKEQRRATWTA
jgi:hypothetical protein